MDFRVGGISLVGMRAPKEFGGQDMYSTWTYTKIVPLREIEYLHHFADKDGNRIAPATTGLASGYAGRSAQSRHPSKPSDDNKTEMTVTEYDWPVGQMMEMSSNGHGAVPRQDGGERCRDLGALPRKQVGPPVVE